MIFSTLVSERKFELEKCSKSFTLLPRKFLECLLDKFMSGCLGNKAWSRGAITVGEVGAEYSHLGGEAISQCALQVQRVHLAWMVRSAQDKGLICRCNLVTLLCLWCIYFNLSVCLYVF